MTDTGWQFRPMGRDRWMVFVMALFGISFVGVFAIGFTLGFNPPLPLMLAAWAAMLTFAIWIARRTCRRAAIEVDDLQKTLTLTRSGLTLPLADVKGFTVETEEKVDSEGDRTTLFHVAVRHGDGRTERFCPWYERATASAVANWLTEAMRVSSTSRSPK